MLLDNTSSDGKNFIFNFQCNTKFYFWNRALALVGNAHFVGYSTFHSGISSLRGANINEYRSICVDLVCR